MMGPLIAILALVGIAAAAGAAKAQPPKRVPTPAKRPRIVRRRAKPRRRPKTRVVTARPAAKVRRKRVAKVRRRMTPREKMFTKKVKGVKISPGPLGQELLANLFRVAASKKTQHPKVREAAKKKIKEISVKPAPVRRAEVKKLPAEAKVEIAKAVVKAEETTKPTAAQAARALQIYTKEGGWQGTRDRPSTMVKNSQKHMGLSPADGIIGPGTRKRAKELGFPLYRRIHQKPGAWRAAA